jgi:hypothetical protein
MKFLAHFLCIVLSTSCFAQPSIQVTPTIAVLDTFDFGNPPYFTYSVTNLGNENLIIYKVGADMVCTWPKEPIPPKKSADIKCKCISDRYLINTTVIVKSNDTLQPTVILRLKSYARPPSNGAIVHSPLVVNQEKSKPNFELNPRPTKDNIDTIVDGIHYNHIRYFNKTLNGVVNFGNYLDSCYERKGRTHRCKHGTWSSYHSREQISFQGEYSYGIPIGWWLEYSSNGNFRRRSKYLADGELDSTYNYHNNGSLESISNYKRIGLSKSMSFYEDNTLKDIINYKDGVRDGVCKTFYWTGHLKEVGIYRNNQKTEDSTVLYTYHPWETKAYIPEAKPKYDKCNNYTYIKNSDDRFFQKGLFKDCKLIQGVEYLYNSKAELSKIKIYKNGKVVNVINVTSQN